MIKHWASEAKYETIQDNTRLSIIEDPKSDDMLCYKFLSQKFLNLAYLDASDPKCCILVDKAFDCHGKQLYDKCSASISILCDTYNVQPNVQQDEEFPSAIHLKKKRLNQEVQSDIEVGLTRHGSTKRKC